MIMQVHHKAKYFARCSFTKRMTFRMRKKDQNDLTLKHLVAREARSPE